jgi:Double zinc ribbon
MQCPGCGFQNPDGMRFCGKCGASIGVTCARCRFENPPGFEFCGECGAPLASSQRADSPLRVLEPRFYTPKHLADKILTSRSALEGERKQVTVLFADIKGSVELMEDLDPEEAQAIVDPALEIMMEPCTATRDTLPARPATASSRCSVLPLLTSTTRNGRFTRLWGLKTRSPGTPRS